MSIRRLIWRQGQVAVNLTDETPGALLRKKQRMFPPPAKARLSRKVDFHNRGRIRKYPVTKWADDFAYCIRQFLQTVANDLVVVAPLGITRNRCLRWVIIIFLMLQVVDRNR